MNEKSYEKGQIFKPFEKFDFDTGSWKVCLVIEDRYEISSKIPSGKYLFTTDINTIKKLKSSSFHYSVGDMATAENKIIFYRNNEIVFWSSIVLDESKSGLQSANYGWVEESEPQLILIIESFKRSLWPIIIL